MGKIWLLEWGIGQIKGPQNSRDKSLGPNYNVHSFGNAAKSAFTFEICAMVRNTWSVCMCLMTLLLPTHIKNPSLPPCVTTFLNKWEIRNPWASVVALHVSPSVFCHKLWQNNSISRFGQLNLAIIYISVACRHVVNLLMVDITGGDDRTVIDYTLLHIFYLHKYM